MLKLLVVDDHKIIREGLKLILSNEEHAVVIEEAETGQQALNKIVDQDFDAILLDISLPGRGGLDVLKDIKSIYPSLAVLILSMYPERQYAVRAMRAGASGYLTKNVSPNELVTAVRTVATGRKYITRAVAEMLALEFGPNINKLPHENLTDREYQIMTMLGVGKTVSDIAKELCLSMKTVSTHRSHILEKMNLNNNAEVIYYAIRNELVQ